MPAIAVGDREPLGERHGGPLGHRVRGRADLREQPGGGRRRAEVATPTFEPAVEETRCSPAVGVDVDVEGELPICLGRREIRAKGHPGVGEEQVDLAERGLGGVDQPDVAVHGRHVGDDRNGAVQAVGHRRGIEDVGDDHSCPGGVEAPGQRFADPACCSGDDHVCAGQFHGGRA